MSSSKSKGTSKEDKDTKKAGDEDKESTKFADSLLKTHASYLTPVILGISSTLDLSREHASVVAGAIYFTLHLVTPVFLLPLLSSLVTLAIPVQNTLRCIAVEKAKGAKEAKDGPQWLYYWIIYGVFELIRGAVGIWRPGWKHFFEIARTFGLITVGGPWFGYQGLVSVSLGDKQY